MHWPMVFGLLGGLGLFLLGLQMMASGLQKAAGDRLRRILEILTGKPLIAVFTGAVVTVLVQSSSTTTVMVVGFANAGLMTLHQAAGTIMGANIGTTVTAQIVSFNIGVLVYPAVALGSLLNFFGRRRLQRYVGQAVLGFGLLFLGLQTMSGQVLPLRESAGFHNLLVIFARYPLLGVFAGALFTALVQSSSATTAVVIALTIQEIISFSSAIPLILGINIGTCFTAVLASLGTNLAARRAAVAHVCFNVIGVVIALLFLQPFMSIVAETAASVPRQVANAHTLFNIFNVLLIIPFFKYFVALVTRLVPGDEQALEIAPKFLDKRMLKTPAVAIGGARQEVLRMARIAREMVKEAFDIFFNNDTKKVQHLLQLEELVDALEKEITVYLAELSQHSLTRQQSQGVAGLMSATNDLERIGDHAQTIMLLAESKIEDKLPFSETALRELREIYENVERMLDKAIKAFTDEDTSLASEVIDDDDLIDDLERTLRKNHIQRITGKKCYPPSGVLYLDLLSNFERIADHATNFAEVVMGEF